MEVDVMGALVVVLHVGSTHISMRLICSSEDFATIVTTVGGTW